MRALSSNMDNYGHFLSTPKLVSDLLFISDLLKNVEKDERNFYLCEIIKELNKNLPANVYIPIQAQSLRFKKVLKSSDQRKRKMELCGRRMHRVLGISTDYAFCLHSKERVPYHIVIKVALDEAPKRRRTSDSVQSQGRSFEDDSSSSSEQLVGPGKKGDPENDTFEADKDSCARSIEMVDLKLKDRHRSDKHLETSPVSQHIPTQTDSSGSPLNSELPLKEHNQNSFYEIDSSSRCSAGSVQAFMKDFKDSDIEGDCSLGSVLRDKTLSPLKDRNKFSVCAPQKKLLHLSSGKVYESDRESSNEASAR